MSMQRPLEGLLRPPVEWYSSTMSLTAAGLLCAWRGWSDRESGKVERMDGNRARGDPGSRRIYVQHRQW